MTSEVTTRALNLFRSTAIAICNERLETLGQRLSLGDHLQEPPAVFTRQVAKHAAFHGEAGEAAMKRNIGETWRQYINLIRLRLPNVEGELGHGQHRSPEGVIADLLFLRETLIEVGAGRIARAELDPLLRFLRTFGFHMAVLDIRQNSAFHDKAIGQLLASNVEPGPGYEAVAWASWIPNSVRPAPSCASRPASAPKPTPWSPAIAPWSRISASMVPPDWAPSSSA